ncbi:MAG: TfpX/TfpZ family type IV pilin accessory protein [Pseudomonas sp.]|nr:TfpX/TfpZ family type IV pilin accessory protein [Pseudomonas sp.]
MIPRLKAFLIHLLISTCIAVAVIGVVFFVWYPAPLHTAAGVTQIFLLLLAVDVVLGPLLTLIVYKSGKKTLIMDLTVIALLQLSALSYGVWTVVEGRPAWLVFGGDRFELVRVPEIDQRNIGTHYLYSSPAWTGPQWVGATNPIDLNVRNDIIFESVNGGFDIYQRPNLYRPLQEINASIQKHAQELSLLNEFNASNDVQNAVKKYPSATAWLPLRAKHQNMVVLINKETAQVIAIVDLRPWD